MNEKPKKVINAHFRDVRVNKLGKKIKDIINLHLNESPMSYASIIGVLELVKSDYITQMDNDERI